MKLPRDVDVRSLAALLFAFVVVVTFGGIAVLSVLCRVISVAGTCVANSPGALEVLKSLIENIVSILLALMAGTAARGPPPPPTN